MWVEEGGVNCACPFQYIAEIQTEFIVATEKGIESRTSHHGSTADGFFGSGGGREATQRLEQLALRVGRVVGLGLGAAADAAVDERVLRQALAGGAQTAGGRGRRAGRRAASGRGGTEAAPLAGAHAVQDHLEQVLEEALHAVVA